MVFDLAASDLRVKVNDGKQALGMVPVLLGYEGKGQNVLF